MTTIPFETLRAYSEGKLSRKTIESDLDAPIGFGELLIQLRDAGLGLPRIPSDPEKVALVRDLVLRAGTDGSGARRE